jgi:PAS domain S-box-containing protein
MKAPTTLPEALSEIQELRGQVRNLLHLLEAEAGTGTAGVAGPSDNKRTVQESLGEPGEPGHPRVMDAQVLTELQQVIGTIPDVIFKLDLQGNLVGWNKRLEVVTDFSPEELNGRPALFFVPEQEYPKTSAAIRRVFEEGYAELEGHLLTKHRVSIPYHWTGAALRDEKGRAIGIAGVGRDVSQKRHIEAELRKQRRLLLWAQTLAHVGSWEWEIASGEMEWSEEQWRIFGHESGTIPSTSERFLAAVQPDDRDRVATEIDEMLKRGGTLDTECRIVRPTGEMRTIHCRGEIIRNEEGHPTHVSGSTVDITDRRQAESALRQSEAHFRALIENSSDIITILDLDGTIRFESPSFERLLGYKQHELNGRVAFEFLHPDDLPMVLEKFQWVITRRGETQTADYRFRHIDGSWMAFEGIGRCILGLDGQPCVIVNSRDITERRQAAEALQRTQFALDHAVDAVYWIDQQANILYANEAASAMVGYSLDELRAMTVHDLNPHFQADVWPGFWAESRLRKSIAVETVHRTKGGQVIPIEVHVNHLAYEGHEFHCAFVRNIAERKRTEKLLRSSEEKLRQALAASNTGLWDWNTETNEVRFSREWKRQLGYEETELPDTYETWEHRLHPDDRARAIDYMQAYLACPQGEYQQEFRLRHKDGTDRWIEARASFVAEPDGRCVRLLGSHIDITGRKRAEQLLEVEKHMLESMAAHQPLGEWLARLCQHCESLSQGLLASVCLLDRDGRHLRHGAAPSLPEAYNRAIDGIAIGPTGGSCGTASYMRRQVIVKDIAVDPLWASYRKLALSHGLRACWSTPIISDAGQVLGTFALYYRTPREPVQDDLHLINRMTSLARLAIERDQAERALKTSEEKLRQSLLASNTGLWDWHTETNEVRLSREWKRQLGYEEAELPDTFESWESRLHPDDHDRAVSYAVRYREHPVGAFRQDFRLRHKDGTYRWIESHASFVTEPDGRRVRLLGSHTDITERKRAEEALRISEERYARATAVGKVGVWELDVPGGSYHADANLKALFGYGVDELSTDPLVWFGLVHPDDRSIAWQAWERVVSGAADEYHYELRVIRKDGTVIWTDVRGHAERDDRGILRRLIGATVDISERKLVQETLAWKEQDLRAALEERERLSQDLHDGILQSLYAVGLGLESCKLLLKRGRSKRAVDAMEQAIGQLNQVMAEIRNFIAGLDSQILQGVDFATTMRSMVESMSTADTPCRLKIDELAVRSISTQQAFHLLNVVREALSNSLRHAKATRISVSLKRLTRSVRLSVKDNGVGFEPATAHGVGHGLANMAARVRKMAGRLVVRSKPQQGTKIVIDLPEGGMA